MLDREEMFFQHAYLARTFASRFRGVKIPNRDLQQKDLQQIAYHGLWAAVGTFDPKLGTFEQHAWYRMRQELEKATRKPDRLTYFKRIHADFEPTSPLDRLIETEDLLRLREMIAELPVRDASLIDIYTQVGEARAEAAKRAGIRNPRYTFARWKRLLTRLRAMF